MIYTALILSRESILHYIKSTSKLEAARKKKFLPWNKSGTRNTCEAPKQCVIKMSHVLLLVALF